MANAGNFTLIFGLVVALFGLSLIVIPKFWRSFGKGVGEVSAATNTMRAKVSGLSKKVKFKGADPKYSPSQKGLKVLGIIFIIFGLLIILLPYI